MKVQSLLRLTRPVALTALLLAILVLSAQPSAWATPAQHPAGQTLPPPTFTPAGAPDITNTPTNTQTSNTATPTATPRGRRRTPTPTTAPTSTAVSQSGAATATSAPGNPGQGGTPPGQGGNNPGQGGNPPGQGGGTGNQPGLPSFPCTVRPANPDPAAPRSMRQAVDNGTNSTLLNCPWSLTIAPGDLNAAATFELKLINAAASQPANAGERFFGPHIELTFFDATGQLIAHPTFAQPLDLCYNYSAADLAPIGDPALFAIELFNTTTQQWERLQTTLDTANSRVCTTLPHLSLYAVAARVPVPGSLPRTGAADDTAPARWAWGLLALGVGAGASLWARRAQRAAQPVEIQKH